MKNPIFQQIIDRIYHREPCAVENNLMSTAYPRIYNKDGRRMEVWFLKGIHFSGSPYGYQSKYFLWDKHNTDLKTHFYTDNAINKLSGNPVHKHGMIYSFKPNFKKGFEKDLDFVFTYDENLLNTIDNAKFYPSCSQVTYGIANGGIGNLDKFVYLSKIKNISIKESNLKWFSDINKYVDVFQTNINIDAALTNYRYSIVMEDEILPYYFTENLLNCFASKTIPIYVGATKISEVFNPDGIIQLSKNDLNNIETILSKCDENVYQEKLSAINDNFERVQSYLNMDDYLFEKYFTA